MVMNVMPMNEQWQQILSRNNRPAAISTMNNITDSEPDIMTNLRYTPALLERYIGKVMKAEFMIGNTLTDRVGRLLTVGASYIVLGMLDTQMIVICDIYSLKFATVILDEEPTETAF